MHPKIRDAIIVILEEKMFDRSKAILLCWFFRFMSWCLNFFVLLAPYICSHILVKFR